jgi:hypothetical protein
MKNEFDDIIDTIGIDEFSFIDSPPIQSPVILPEPEPITFVEKSKIVLSIFVNHLFKKIG